MTSSVLDWLFKGKGFDVYVCHVVHFFSFNG